MTTSLTGVTAVGAGLAGGVFLGFSGFVMRALDALPADQSVRAMQSINRFAPTPLFMTVLFGTGVAAVALALTRREPLVLAACGVYLVGVLGVTVAGNVPLNDTLAAVDPAGRGVAQHWADFSGPWTLLNHVRTAAGLAAAAMLTAA